MVIPRYLGWPQQHILINHGHLWLSKPDKLTGPNSSGHLCISWLTDRSLSVLSTPVTQASTPPPPPLGPVENIHKRPIWGNSKSVILDWNNNSLFAIMVNLSKFVIGCNWSFVFHHSSKNGYHTYIHVSVISMVLNSLDSWFPYVMI